MRAVAQTCFDALTLWENDGFLSFLSDLRKDPRLLPHSRLGSASRSSEVGDLNTSRVSPRFADQ